MRRRALIANIAGATAWPLVARAQQKAMPVIGYLGNTRPDSGDAGMAQFHEGLKESGYVQGQNVQIEYRWTEGQYDRLAALAAALVERKVDVLISTGGPTGALAARAATSTIPIVFVTGDDPVESGLVACLARPGGNITGVSILAVELIPKQLEVLSELIPGAKTIGLLANPTNVNAERVLGEAQRAARAKGKHLQVVNATKDTDIDAAFPIFKEGKASALIVGTDPFFYVRRSQLVTLAAHHAIPAVYDRRDFVASGGLVSYGTNPLIVIRQLGAYAGRILKGAKPAELPIVQPTKYELLINLRAAKQLSLALSPSILARADEVIE